jgi:hypothetical protein
VRSYLFFIPFLFFAAIFQGAVRHFPLPDLKVDVVWLGVLFLGFYVPLLPGGLIVLALGLVQETLGAPLHGVLPLAHLAVYFFLRLTYQNLFIQRKPSQVIWVSLLSLAYRGVEAGLLVWQGYEVPTGSDRLLAWALLEGFVSLAVFPFFKIVGKMDRPFGVS